MKNKSFKNLLSLLLTIGMVLFSFSSVFASASTVTVLSAPTNLVATAGESQINLNWSPVQGATYYNVYKSQDGLNYNLISVPATVTTVAYDVTNLTNGKMYYFKITASSEDSQSTYSNVSSETPSVRTSPVEIGMAGNYAVLSKTGISSVPNSVITGNIGVSPIDSTGITGFSLTMDATNEFSGSAQINGKATHQIMLLQLLVSLLQL